MKIIVIILAGGIGSRMNSSENKVFLSLCGKTVIRRSVDAFSGIADEMIIVSKTEDKKRMIDQLDSYDSVPFSIIEGGKTRQQSVANGLSYVKAEDNDIILIHDAARCLVDQDLIARVISSVKKCGTGIPGIAATSTYKICDQDHFVISTPDRSSLYEVQTPQGFRAGQIINAYRKASVDNNVYTDDAGILERYGMQVKIVPGSTTNIKITYPEDIVRAITILEGGRFSLRVGMGYDVHQLVPDRRLILCGVKIPYHLGLLGHSDADVSLHALMDAMLGACGLGDIGKIFPDSDDKWKGASSLDLLNIVNNMIQNDHFYVHNADITIVAQNPKLLPYIPFMVKNIQQVLKLSDHCINIKATTTEHLGFEGRMEGISSYAVCTVMEKI